MTMMPLSNNSDNKLRRNGAQTAAKSGSLLGTYVWVRIDLVEALVENRGILPTDWKPRKRVRAPLKDTHSQQQDDKCIHDNGGRSWGWCRALVFSASILSPNSPDRTMKLDSRKRGDIIQRVPSENTNPFSQIALRKTNRLQVTSSNPMGSVQDSWKPSPEKVQRSVAITITVNDTELAPPHLQNTTVSFTYESSDSTKVCVANTWWQHHTDHDESDGNHFSESFPPEDLTTLEQLHEPAVVFCLQKRYELDQIYTYTGKILLAMNPFRSIDHLYTEDTMKIYWNAGKMLKPNADSNESHGIGSLSEISRPPPHIYAIAEDAYRSMVRSLENFSLHKAEGRNQSILVSGESGAGKTVTTKIILRYLATLSAEKQKCRNLHAHNIATIESQVLESNPILESFGNARTSRNDNSSRFGKFMEMQFDSSGCLISASIETYLLEKVRLVSQSHGERNYHIFYEILAGLPRKYRRKFRMTEHDSAFDFRMTAISGTFDRRDAVSDADTFHDLKNALNIVGFTESEQNDLFHVVCALLHTSNLTFCEEHCADSSIIDPRSPGIESASLLLGVDSNALNDALTKCAIVVRDDIVYKNLPVDRAVKAVEAFIKTTYGALFNFIVRKINNFVTVPQASLSTHTSKYNISKQTATIGVLDIFGFESFEKNSFEQLCINYCNEALQQQFNRFVFKLEQEEYEKEGIEWSFIEFPDNQDVLDMIEKKHEGILSILDEQSRLPRCTDSTFAAAIYDKLSNHKRLNVTKTQRARLTFSIEHYAGPVEYDTEFFLEKNKDELPKETTELLMSSSHVFLANLGRDLTDALSSSTKINNHNQTWSKLITQQPMKPSSLNKESVGTQFSSQLRILRTRIEGTEPHYVRCLKPNDNLFPYMFDHLVISDQLRCAGVLEAIRVSRIGFPHRYYHAHFLQRYLLLKQPKLGKKNYSIDSKKNSKDLCESLILALIPEVIDTLDENSDSIKVGKSAQYLGLQLGKTKVFLRRRAFEALEYLRSKKLDGSATKMQSLYRMYVCKIHYAKIYRAILRIQGFVRDIELYLRKRAQRLHDAAITIQASIRCLRPRQIFLAARWIAFWCQSIHRGATARKYCAYLFLDRNASLIQRAWKHFRLTFVFRKLRRCVITIQNKYRSKLSRRELCRLRREARDLMAVAAERDRLREESRRLREELEKARFVASPIKPSYPERENELLKLRNEVQRLHFELEKAHRMNSPSKRNESNAKRLIEELAEREDELDRLKRELDAVRSREETSSVRSMTVATSHASEFSLRLPRPRRSSVLSATSLLDSEAGQYDNRLDFISSISNAQYELRSIADYGAEVQLLHNAIRDGDIGLVTHILSVTSEVCVLINQGDKFGRTAIHIASLSLNTEIADTLILKGAVVNAQDDDGETPLHLAENVEMTEVLIAKGRANPNIPNVDGICALHLAVQRRDFESTQLLVSRNANVNSADNVRWFTSLHLIALPARLNDNKKFNDRLRLRIAKVLTSTIGKNVPDLNYQDSEGNTPLHYAVQMETDDCCDLVSLFLERGANPNIRNIRDQIPLHLLCHNTELRKFTNFQEIIHVMMMYGADPNTQSLTGCSPLHLCLYHRDIDTAVQLVHNGAELHLIWKKPKRWPSFWKDMGSSRVVALDMVEESKDLTRILSSITTPHKVAPNRPWCMHCKQAFVKSSFSVHCSHCSRLVCRTCANTSLSPAYFPISFKVSEPCWVCVTCDKILISQKEAMDRITLKVSSMDVDSDDEDRFSC